MDIYKILKSYPITLLTVTLVWYLCFFTPPSTKLDHVIGIDKVVHFGMYAFLTTVLLWERVKSQVPRAKCKDSGVKGQESMTIGYLFLTLFSPILMSGLIEVLQENCTGGRRSGDIWDFAANSIGAITAWLLWRYWVSRKLIKWN